MKKKNDELSKKVNTDSVLSTVAECTASTNSSDIAGASALAELNESLSAKHECGGYSIIGNVANFSFTVQEDGIYFITVAATASVEKATLNLVKNGIQCSPLNEAGYAYQLLQCTIMEKLSVGDVISANHYEVGEYAGRRLYYSVVKL